MSRHALRARAGESRASLYDEITNKIIAELEAGRVPWVQPWGTAAAKAPLAMPKNAATGRQYSGINVLILWGAVVEHGFTGQSWLTFRQALSLGGHVRKGEHGTTVVYADRFIPDDEKKRATRDRRGSAGDSIPQALHGLQHGPVRRSPGRIATVAPPPPPGTDRATGRGADQGDRHRLPHRRQSRLLYPGARLCAGAAAARLFRANQLAPHRAARTRRMPAAIASRLNRDLSGTLRHRRNMPSRN